MKNLLSKNATYKVHKRRKCQKCKKKLGRFEGDIHHIIPISKGGTNRFSNLMLVCEVCHEKIHSEESKEEKE